MFLFCRIKISFGGGFKTRFFRQKIQNKNTLNQEIDFSKITDGVVKNKNNYFFIYKPIKKQILEKQNTIIYSIIKNKKKINQNDIKTLEFYKDKSDNKFVFHLSNDNDNFEFNYLFYNVSKINTLTSLEKISENHNNLFSNYKFKFKTNNNKIQISQFENAIFIDPDISLFQNLEELKTNIFTQEDFEQVINIANLIKPINDIQDKTEINKLENINIETYLTPDMLKNIDYFHKRFLLKELFCSFMFEYTNENQWEERDNIDFLSEYNSFGCIFNLYFLSLLIRPKIVHLSQNQQRSNLIFCISIKRHVFAFSAEFDQIIYILQGFLNKKNSNNQILKDILNIFAIPILLGYRFKEKWIIFISYDFLRNSFNLHIYYWPYIVGQKTIEYRRVEDPSEINLY